MMSKVIKWSWWGQKEVSFKMEEITICFYANGNDPVEREREREQLLERCPLLALRSEEIIPSSEVEGLTSDGSMDSSLLVVD